MGYKVQLNETMMAIKSDLSATRVVEGQDSALDSLDQLMSIEAVNRNTLSPPVATPNVDATVLTFPNEMQVILNHPFSDVVSFLGIYFDSRVLWD